MKNIKVIMVGPNRRGKGGIASVVNQYYNAGLDKKVKIHYISTAVDGPLFLKYLEMGKGLLLFLFQLPFSQIVHIHMASRGSYERKKIFVWIAKKFQKKVVLHIHGAEFHIFYGVESDDQKKTEIRRVFSMADTIIVLSEEWKEYFQNWVSASKLKILHNSVRLPNEFQKDYESQRILFLGRLEERKGIYDILKILPDVIKRFPESLFLLGGDGEIENCRRIVQESGMEKNVHILGWIDGMKKEELLKTSDIFLLPSYNEGMPMALLEAMAWGCAVISTDVGGIPQVIEQGINGLLICPGDTEALKNKILELLSDTKTQANLGVAARKTIKESFDIKRNLKKLIEIYQKLGNGK